MPKLKFTPHQKQYMNVAARKWVQVLHDNEMDQAQEQLQVGNGYCCLGVAALCYQMETGEELPIGADGNYENVALEDKFEVVLDWTKRLLWNASWWKFCHS